MKTRIILLILLSLLAVVGAPSYASPVVLQQNFNGVGGAPYHLITGGKQTPRILNGALRLLDGAPDQAHVVVFDRKARGLYSHITATWKMRLLPGADGASFMLLNTRQYGTKGTPDFYGFQSWEEPTLPQAFAVGFDIYNPPSENPFNADGNIYNRPQREISLHWNGAEIVKRLSPVEFRGEALQEIGVTLEFVTGGAEVSVRVGQKDVYQNYFVPGLLPFENRVALGARSGSVTTTCDLKDLRVAYEQPIHATLPPLALTAIDHQVVDAKHYRQSRLVNFPTNTDAIGRIVLTLTLSEPPGGYDPWDRKGAVYVYDERGERFEIVRFITPYHQGFTWQVDVTDYRPLLLRQKKVEVWCETYATGWLATVHFDFYPGSIVHGGYKAYKVQNLWVGEPEIGNLDKPVTNFFVPKTISRDPDAAVMKLRFTVTGHGMEPNSRNAAEFMPSRRTVTLGNHSWDNLLWKTDNYLNPCRPQGGTWKFDRAGWGPGTIVAPWDIDITSALAPGQTSKLSYTLEPYVNENRGKTYAPTHWVESQVIYYRRVK
ncbi:MAG: hypothetical protein JO316_04400 [Abitibacteriaceae bacterium]|nr:hypothetical protein [Abditibacteriaceae bacterium]